jgi:hypothetical protein
VPHHKSFHLPGSAQPTVEQISPQRRGDRGQATPLVIGVIAIAAASLIPIARLARAATDAAQARSAADAAALAGVVDGPAGARRGAAANDGTLVSFVRIGSDVVVTVSVGAATAKARATLNGG